MHNLIDENVIEQMKDDLDDETCHKLIGLFIEETTSLLADLEKAFEVMDLPTIESVTHILKNSAALYGAVSVAIAAKDINDRLSSPSKMITREDSQLLALINKTLKVYNSKYNKAL
ncbi:Hpt domain-containing protein [Psychromonas sp. SP041]|uniref:Hpt domain-containing protein n=1 Tax=Psychromonas sp. SP041 TaxID=1365007 RepID=UPI00041ABFB9|nr:Hpt domain-containing protein [Psychromonas sp. SP041]